MWLRSRGGFNKEAPPVEDQQGFSTELHLSGLALAITVHLFSPSFFYIGMLTFTDKLIGAVLVRSIEAGVNYSVSEIQPHRGHSSLQKRVAPDRKTSDERLFKVAV